MKKVNKAYNKIDKFILDILKKGKKEFKVSEITKNMNEEQVKKANELYWEASSYMSSNNSPFNDIIGAYNNTRLITLLNRLIKRENLILIKKRPAFIYKVI